MKTICMIPVRKGSQRVKGKALRKIGDKSLIENAIELSLTHFDSSHVFLNTNWNELKPISDNYGINFYNRDESLCTSTSTNDQFVFDFLSKISCERLVQLLPTSPFVTASEFSEFCTASSDLADEALISVGSHRIACVLEDGSPINFERSKQNPPSQTMKAVLSYVGVLMSWNSARFKSLYLENNCAYHGDNLNKFFSLSFLSQLDIDNEEDLLIAQKLESLLPSHV